MSKRLVSSLLAATLALGAGGLVLGSHPAPAVAAPKAKAKAAPKPPAISAAHAQALDELRGPYSFGMTVKEVGAVLSQQLDDAYAERIAATTDVATQDRLRREKKEELAEVKQTFVHFDGKRTGWDVSLVAGEFAHNTGECMLVHWENDGGKNQRRFFFFHHGVLWKMYVSLDTSDLADESRTFDVFKGAMEGRFGPGVAEGSTITWTNGNYRVQLRTSCASTTRWAWP
ncbi:MAG: hypothetical protein R2939_21895 [Kofleriaceae bacterium]